MDSKISNLESLLSQLDGFLADWAAKGFEVRNNRIGRYRTSLEQLVLLGAEGRGKMTDQQAAEAILMFEEVQQFIFTSERVLSHPHLMASRQAKEMFSGSLMAGTENDTLVRIDRTAHEAMLARLYGGSLPISHDTWKRSSHLVPQL